jgi:hypothetical protein
MLPINSIIPIHCRELGELGCQNGLFVFSFLFPRWQLLFNSAIIFQLVPSVFFFHVADFPQIADDYRLITHLCFNNEVTDRLIGSLCTWVNCQVRVTALA